MEEMRQVSMDNNLQTHVHRVGESSFEARVVGREATPWGGSKGKWTLSHYDETKSHGNSRIVASGTRKDPPRGDNSGVDLQRTLNAKKGWKEGTPWAKHDTFLSKLQLSRQRHIQ